MFSLYELKKSRMVRFLAVHTVVSIAAGAMIIKEFTKHTGPVFPDYFVTTVEAFFGSFAGGMLGIIVMMKHLVYGYASPPMMDLFGKPAPMPIVAGVAGLAAVLLTIAGFKALSRIFMWIGFIGGSLLFTFSAHTIFVGMPGICGRLLGL